MKKKKLKLYKEGEMLNKTINNNSKSKHNQDQKARILHWFRPIILRSQIQKLKKLSQN